MPANTSPDNIEYPVSTDPVAPLETVFANMANSVQDALDGFRTDWNDFEDSRAIQTFRWADATARAAQTGMVAGDVGYQIDTGVRYQYDGSGWVAWSSNWITWTTAPTGITVGTGGSASSLQRYKYINGRALVEYKFVLGSSGSSVGTAPYITLPFTISLPVPRYAVLAGDGNAYDLSATLNYYTKARVNDPSTSQVLISSYAGTFTNITSSAPFAWAAGDIIQGEFWVDVA